MVGIFLATIVGTITNSVWPIIGLISSPINIVKRIVKTTFRAVASYQSFISRPNKSFENKNSNKATGWFPIFVQGYTMDTISCTKYLVSTFLGFLEVVRQGVEISLNICCRVRRQSSRPNLE